MTNASAQRTLRTPEEEANRKVLIEARCRLDNITSPYTHLATLAEQARERGDFERAERLYRQTFGAEVTLSLTDAVQCIRGEQAAMLAGSDVLRTKDITLRD